MGPATREDYGRCASRLAEASPVFDGVDEAEDHVAVVARLHTPAPVLQHVHPVVIARLFRVSPEVAEVGVLATC